MKTKRNLIYDDKILLTGSTISFFYVDINLSYEIDLGSRFFIEPYVGIIRNNPSSNIVHPNGEFLELRSTNGMTFGLNFIKYIRVVKDVFIGPFIGLSYDKMDFKNFSTYLSNNSKRFNLGIVLKAVDKKYQTKGKTIKGFQKLDGAPVY